MRYYFEKYFFDQDTFTLYYNEQPKALKSNEAKLLALFIENKDEILSKERILSQIWGEQSVSEQVVFQNISQLRSLFGSKAIKTFPKKGYQWQLPFETEQALKSELVIPPDMPVARSSLHLYWAIGLLLIVALAVMFWYFPKEQLSQNQSKNKLYLIPFSLAGEAEQNQLNNFNRLITQYRSYHTDAERFSSTNTLSLFSYPDITRETIKLGNDSVMISGYLSSQDELLLVEYKLLGAKRNWSGYLIGQDEKALATSLNSTIEGIQSTGYLSEPNSALLSSKLNLLLEQLPNDQSVIYQLIRQQFKNQNYDVAKALIEKLISLSEKNTNSPYMVLGLFIKGAIYHQQKEYQHAFKYYNRALTQLTDNKFSEIAYKIEISLAWLAYEQHASERMQKHIQNAAMYAEQKNDVLAQISANTTGSILSHKLGDILNRYQYLNTAKSLLITHQVAEAHFAIIYYHLALFAPDKKEAESYYLKVLSLPKLTKHQWLYESTTEDLLTWYIEKKQWQDALALFHSQPENSFNLSQRARLLHAQKDYIGAINSAKQAFDQARLNYQYNNALHAALLLYQLQEHLIDSQTPDYINYISKNASKFWIEKHKNELIKLGYFDDLAQAN